MVEGGCGGRPRKSQSIDPAFKERTILSGKTECKTVFHSLEAREKNKY